MLPRNADSLSPHDERSKRETTIIFAPCNTDCNIMFQANIEDGFPHAQVFKDLAGMLGFAQPNRRPTYVSLSPAGERGPKSARAKPLCANICTPSQKLKFETDRGLLRGQNIQFDLEGCLRT